MVLSAMVMRLTNRFESVPAWVKNAGIAGAVSIISLLFLWPSSREFPMDDTYIHFVYARNLVDGGGLFFNYLGEKGVGTTSILWVLLLSGGIKAGVTVNWLAKILGIACLAVVGIGIHQLLFSFRRPAFAFAAGLLVAASGNMLWFALSGMDTMLFLALGVLALLTYRAGRWGWLGVCLGLLVLARPEGIALTAAIGFIDLLCHKRLTKGFVLSAAICILLCGPWFAYLLARTGHFLPTSGLGKHLSNAVAMNYLLEKFGAAALAGRIPGLLYIFSWVGYLLEFTLGGKSLPAPFISLGNVAGNAYTLSVWSIPGCILVIGLLAAAFKKLAVPHRWQVWIDDPARRSMLVLAVWTILHNLSYMVFLPIPGTASRYGALNHVVLWLLLLEGLSTFAQYLPRMLSFAAALAMIAIANTVYWNGIYDANLEHMQKVRMAAAYYIRDNIPQDEVCAAYDIGAMRYFSRRSILDLGGLVDPDASAWFLAGAFDQYLVNKNVTCLVLPGRAGVADEGWFDFAGMMGLTSSPLIRMQRLEVFEIDRERWLQGYLPTGNYQASVTIYRLELSNPSSR